jgi:ABC-type transporter Mla subunit MlaD
MALQDLTPQLRTRLNRMERAVGWFVFLATALLLFGFGYYIYQKAEQKGWFLTKAKFLTYVHDASGLNIGDPVMLMGFQVGQITSIAAMPPRTPHDIRIEFEINQVNQGGQPYFSYIWSEGSQVKINASDFLGKRSLEVTRGTNGFGVYNTHTLVELSVQQAESLAAPDDWRLAENIYDENSNLVLRAFRTLAKTNIDQIAALKRESVWAFHDTENHHETTAAWNQQLQRYEKWDGKTSEPYWLPVFESPAVTEQLQAMVSQVQSALPGILALTNRIAMVLDNAANATSNLNVTLIETRPMITNFASISAQLSEPGGPMVWALGTNGNEQLQGSLTNVNALLGHTDTNLAALLSHTDTNLAALLINLADITSNLNAQVQSNSNILSSVSKIVVDTDDFVQGLKRHWLLRSAFKSENAAVNTNAPPPDLRSPRQR